MSSTEVDSAIYNFHQPFRLQGSLTLKAQKSRTLSSDPASVVELPKRHQDETGATEKTPGYKLREFVIEDTQIQQSSNQSYNHIWYGYIFWLDDLY